MSNERHAGRKKDWVWLHVSVEGDKAKCNHCDEKLSKRSGRISTHLDKCRKYKIAEERTSVEEQAPSTSDVPDPPKRMRLNNFVTKTSSEQKKQLDIQVARFFFSANLSFNTAKNKEWLRMCELLHPGYKPPNKNLLAEDLLDAVYDEIEAKAKEDLKSVDKVVLSQDGWESVSHDPILAHSFHDGEKSHLLDVTDCGSHKKDSDYCLEKLEDAIEEIEEGLGKKVIGVVTDNENKMKKMKRLLKEKNKQLLAWGCQAHMLNLLEGDICDKAMLGKINDVSKFFSNVHRAHGLLKEKGGKSGKVVFHIWFCLE